MLMSFREGVIWGWGGGYPASGPGCHAFQFVVLVSCLLTHWPVGHSCAEHRGLRSGRIDQVYTGGCTSACRWSAREAPSRTRPRR